MENAKSWVTCFVTHAPHIVSHVGVWLPFSTIVSGSMLKACGFLGTGRNLPVDSSLNCSRWGEELAYVRHTTSEGFCKARLSELPLI